MVGSWLITEFVNSSISRPYGYARSLSDLTGRNEKLAVRGQIVENLRANSRAIWRKLSGIWADQAILQSAHGKPGSLLEFFGEMGTNGSGIFWLLARHRQSCSVRDLS